MHDFLPNPDFVNSSRFEDFNVEKRAFSSATYFYVVALHFDIKLLQAFGVFSFLSEGWEKSLTQCGQASKLALQARKQ